jgi:hypothetical protein
MREWRRHAEGASSARRAMRSQEQVAEEAGVTDAGATVAAGWPAGPKAAGAETPQHPPRWMVARSPAV